ncbi:MAG TPA: hypothetical protein VFT82_00245 [Candidatus Paceibacterota bacterium]|nr:hypothetical protein [Candidatus Paceibacterota bacterium]
MNDEDSSSHRQDSVMQDYRTSRAVRSEEDRWALHSFFSPTMVPPGLTDEEALLCIALYPLKKAWEKRRQERIEAELLPHMPKFEVYPPEFIAASLAVHRSLFPTPEELSSTSPMTRAGFARGIRKTMTLLLAPP